MRVLFFIAFIFISSVSLAGEFDGKYRLNKSWDCTSVGSDGGAISIKGKKFFGVESFCAMTNPVKVRDFNATLYDLDCSGEGEKWNSRMMFMHKEGGIYIVQKGSVGKWERCIK